MKKVFIASIMFFMAIGIIIFLRHQGTALKFLNYLFWLLLLGVVLYLRDLKNAK